jgi:hypothetical protein
LEDIGIDVSVIFKSVLRERWKVVDRIILAQGRAKWWAGVSDESLGSKSVLDLSSSSGNIGS